MHVHIIGPNLPDQSLGDFHVHAAGCAEVTRDRQYSSTDFSWDRANTTEVTSRRDAAAQTYADQIGEGSMTADDAVHSLWFAPCTDQLPEADEANLDDRPCAAVEDFLEHAQVDHDREAAQLRVTFNNVTHTFPDGSVAQSETGVYAVMFGSPVDGMSLNGPFADVETATSYAEASPHLREFSWWVVPIFAP